MVMSGESLHRDRAGPHGGLNWSGPGHVGSTCIQNPASTFRAAVGPSQPTGSQHVACTPRAPIGCIGGSNQACQ